MTHATEQLELIQLPRVSKNGMANKLYDSDRAFHDWYRFVLSFPPHLVRNYFNKFGLCKEDIVLDPFCGTGTTLIEAKLYGMRSIGIEANSMAYFAASTKVNWNLDAELVLNHALEISKLASICSQPLDYKRMKTLPEQTFDILIKDSISPLPLHKSLVLLDTINSLKIDEQMYRCELLALAKAIILSSNLYFGPEVGVRKIKKNDANVVEIWLCEMRSIVKDIKFAEKKSPQAIIYQADARDLSQILTPGSIDAVFTSPPYPNEKDYTRTTRLESVILGFIKNKTELRLLKKGLLRSNTRNVYKGDDDDCWIVKNSEIQAIAQAIEKKRIALCKTSGFEKLYGKVTKLYFGGMARHLATLRPLLKPGAYLGYVVGDQASYLQVMIRTGQLLSSIAESLGYEVISIDLFRTRLATATKTQMREEVVVLRWPGN